MTITISGSQLPLAATCAASVIEPSVRLSTTNEPQRVGNATHDAIGEAINDGPMNADIIERCAEAEGAPAADVSPLAWSAWKWWQKWQHLFPDPHVEESLSLLNLDFDVELTGHPDVWSLAEGQDGPEIRVVDWKTGYGEVDAWDQVNGYALLALRNSEQPAVQVYRAIVPLRHAEWDGGHLSIDALEGWWLNILNSLSNPNIKDLREEYVPGPHCGHCPRNHECPGLAAAVNRAVAIAGVATGWLDRDAPSLYAAAKLLEDLGEGMRKLVKGMVEAAGGKVEADGRTLELVRQERRVIETSPDAQEILERYLPRAVIDQHTRFGKTEIVKAAGGYAPKGMKKGAFRESLLGELDSAGCLSTTFVERLELRKSPQETKQISAEPKEIEAVQ
jgi:hypothetical protein